MEFINYSKVHNINVYLVNYSIINMRQENTQRVIWIKLPFNDAMSLSWYPYNWSHISQYAEYTKWNNIAKGVAINHDKMFYWRKNTTTKQQSKHKNPSQRRDLKAGPLASQSNALRLDQLENWVYQLLSIYLTVSM